jgi:hypothetical protein
MIKNEHKKKTRKEEGEMKKQHHVLPGPAHLVLSRNCAAEIFTAESRLLRSRLY